MFLVYRRGNLGYAAFAVIVGIEAFGEARGLGRVGLGEILEVRPDIAD